MRRVAAARRNEIDRLGVGRILSRASLSRTIRERRRSHDESERNGEAIAGARRSRFECRSPRGRRRPLRAAFPRDGPSSWRVSNRSPAPARTGRRRSGNPDAVGFQPTVRRTSGRSPVDGAQSRTDTSPASSAVMLPSPIAENALVEEDRVGSTLRTQARRSGAFRQSDAFRRLDAGSRWRRVSWSVTSVDSVVCRRPRKPVVSSFSADRHSPFRLVEPIAWASNARSVRSSASCC